MPVLASTSAQADGAQSDTRQLQSTVEALANQMAWFVEKMTQAEDAYDESGQQEVDEASVVLSTHSAPMTDTSPEGGRSTSLGHPYGSRTFYNVADTVGADVDQQLATIVTNLAKNRLPEEKLKEKLATYVRPGNCEALTVTRVNGEISAATKSRDLKAQRGQNATVQAMVAITTAADNLVVGTRSGETLSQEKMAVTLTGLVDALALLNYANQDVNQRRREDHRGDLNQAYKGISNSDTDGSAWLYGDDLPSRIKAIGETNRVSSRVGSQPTFSGYGRATTRGWGNVAGRFQPFFTHKPRWMGRGGFRGAFLGPDYRPNSRGRSFQRRGGGIVRGQGDRQVGPETRHSRQGQDQDRSRWTRT